MGQGMIRFSEAAKHYKELPHQLSAWNYLQEKAPRELLEEFAELYRSAPKTSQPPSWLPKALDFIKEWEGFSPTPYHDVAGVMTIGYGETQLEGREVRDSDRLSKAEAEVLLARRLQQDYAPALFRLLPKAQAWQPAQIAALVSWLYNVGAGAAASSTLVKRLNAGEPPLVVIEQELVKWNRAGGEVVEGLKNRRAAEVALFSGGIRVAQMPNPLPVPYYSQRDGRHGEANRMCFASSCAMAVAYRKPGVLRPLDGDDQYLQTVKRYGDTTDAYAQLKAMAHYGVEARFVQNADFNTLERQLAQGLPVPCGFLHHGPSSAPKGGGHWLTVIGSTPDAVIVNDPFGQMDVASGAYLNINGSWRHYARSHWGRRWMVEGPSTGWAILLDP